MNQSVNKLVLHVIIIIEGANPLYYIFFAAASVEATVLVNSKCFQFFHV